MTEPTTPPPAEHPPGEHIHFPEVAWPEPAEDARLVVTMGPAYGNFPDHAPVPLPEPPPMADERFAHPLEPESRVAAYILLLPTLLALVAVVARAEGWL